MLFWLAKIFATEGGPTTNKSPRDKVGRNAQEKPNGGDPSANRGVRGPRIALFPRLVGRGFAFKTEPSGNSGKEIFQKKKKNQERKTNAARGP